jgi:hypothetical protein
MIICSSSNIDIIQGDVAYGSTINANESILDWRLENSNVGVFNILNSSSTVPRISVIENGNIGIGIVPAPSSAKMEIVGDINISGIFKKNYRDILADTSNYICSTSNILVSRINAGGSGSGSAITSGGNLTISNNSTPSTLLSIQNSNFSFITSNYTSNVIITPFVATFTGTGNTAPSTHAQVTDTPKDRYMIFTTSSVNHIFTIPSGGLNCDILMIGGGGAGYAGGGGAGACIIAINQRLPDGICKVIVGAGSATITSDGNPSSISVGTTTIYLASGGGKGAGTFDNGLYTDGTSGGCGAGAGFGELGPKLGGLPVSTNIVGAVTGIGPSLTSTYAVLGNRGGNQYDTGSLSGISTPGGGGIGAAGVDHLFGNGTVGGNGAYQVTLSGSSIPINFRSYFANGSTSFGVQDGTTGNYYIGGGGGGYNIGTNVNANIGGLGGGGRGKWLLGNAGSSTEAPTSGITNTGSGGGGNTSLGGSGIVIIRYRSVTTTTTPTTITVPTTILGLPSIELIRGTPSDSNLDYKIGNYNGDFKVMSAISNTDTERLVITSSGNVGIGTTNPMNELHMFDSLTNSTSLTIQNSNISFIASPVITPTNVSGGTFSVGQTNGSIDRFMIFTTGTSSFTVPAGGIICDILMIGGGGAGGYGGNQGVGGGAGGGAGACIVAINQPLTAGVSISIIVGAGDAQSTANTGTGGDSSISIAGSTRYLAKGGGRGERDAQGRNAGGCGGGTGTSSIRTGGLAVNTNMVEGTIVNANSRSSTFAVFGNKGGDQEDGRGESAGGGGIGGAGGNHLSGNVNAGPGGVGLFQATVGGTTYNFRSYFANGGTPFNFGTLNSADGNYYIGGGGGGSVFTTIHDKGPNVGGIGGAGGGGNGGIRVRLNPDNTNLGALDATSGATNTGSGGGGGYYSDRPAGSGGSGIVIIRYRMAPVTIGVPSVELVRGVAGDSNHDYKVGNYDGNFKIMSAVSGTSDMERLNISSVGNVGIGTSSPANELHIFDSTTSSTSLIIQNNNLVTTTNTVQGTSTVNGISQGTLTDTNQQSISYTGTVGSITLPPNTIFITAEVWGASGGSGKSDEPGYSGGAGGYIKGTNIPTPGITTLYYLVGGEGFTTGNTRSGGGGGGYSAIWYGSSDPSLGTWLISAGGGGGGGSYGLGLNNGSGGGNGGANFQYTSIGKSVGSGGSASAAGNNGISTGGGAGGGAQGDFGAGGGGGSYGISGGIGGDGNGGDGGYGGYGGGGGGGGGGSGGVIERTCPGGGGGGGYIGGNGGSNGPSIGGQGGSGGYNTIVSGATLTANIAGQRGGNGSIIITTKISYVATTTSYTHTPTITTTTTSTLQGNSAIELVRGTQGDSNTDYKIGNYGGDFKVISSISNTDTDRLNITPAGNVGIGTTSPQVKLHVTGDIYATGNITGYFSDERLKTKIANIHNPLEIIRRLNGFYYIPNDLAHFNGIYNTDMEVGLSAQEVQRVLPEIVKIAPFDSVRNAEGVIVSKSGENYLTMSYERLTPVFVEAIKELEEINIEMNKEITLINETLMLF